MTKYGLIYENDKNEIVYNGHFIGKNHYKIKFVMYRYLKKILTLEKPIIFAIYEVRTRDLHIYIGKTQTRKIKPSRIALINRVYKATDKEADRFTHKIKEQSLPYNRTHQYIEEYNDDDLSMSETDSELEDLLDEDKMYMDEKEWLRESTYEYN